MADWHGNMSKGSKGGHRRPMREEDFEEGDVWSFVNENDSQDSSPKRNSYNEYSSASSSAWRFTTAPRMIPRVSNMPTTGHEANKVIQQSSSPMKIPDWSKIYGKNKKFGSSKNGSCVDGICNGAAYNEGECHVYGVGDDDNEDDDDGDDGMVPPHEWLARKLARNQISSFSVCEGIGRTLKGRDLSKVRNAILTKTGFLE